MQKIFLTQNKFAIVDDEDYERLNQHNWYAMKSRNGYRAARMVGGRKNRFVQYLHREIMGLKKGDKKQVDHYDLNELNNQKNNLRIATNQQNSYNTKARGRSKYKGVVWRKRIRKWIVRITCSGKTKWLGAFVKEIDAAKAYDVAAKELFGDFANCNF